jgi:hypothetical protein
MTKYKWNLGVVLCAATLAGACTDAENAAGPVAPTAQGARSATGNVQAEAATLNEITRAVALAMNDEGLRHRVKNDMRRSPFAEHKLEFRDYLKGQSGGILLAKMAKETGKTREEVLALLDRVRPLEFYIPNDQHRENWTGDANIQIASWLEGIGAVGTGYKPSGEVVLIGTTTIPALPTLVIVQKETNFRVPLDLTRFKNVRDQGGQTIGTYSIEAPVYEVDGGGGGGGGGSTGGGSTPTRYRSNEGYGKQERMFEYKLGRHLESNWTFQGDPELRVVVTSHAPSPYNASLPNFQSTIEFGSGGNDDTNWYRDNSDLVRWNQEYGNYMNLKFYEADSESLIPITVTFAGKTYGIMITDSNDDLGNWTYSFFDQSLTAGYDGGHGIGKWGLNTGSNNITVITDYVTP